MRLLWWEDGWLGPEMELVVWIQQNNGHQVDAKMPWRPDDGLWEPQIHQEPLTLYTTPAAWSFCFA